MKACAAVMIALVLCLILNKHAKDISLVLSITVCALLAFAVIEMLEPVFSFLYTLESAVGADKTMLQVLIKCVGIGILGEITATICSDSGNAALGKTLQTLSAAVILYMSIPLFEALTDLIQEILMDI